MKFLIDAQLPRSLAHYFRNMGYDCLHTLDLPEKNASSDDFISAFSLKEKRIVISKDVDFYNRYLQKLEPYKLIYITTGNIPNEKLLNLFRKNLDKIIDGIQHNHVIEITTTSIITII